MLSGSVLLRKEPGNHRSDEDLVIAHRRCPPPHAHHTHTHFNCAPFERKRAQELHKSFIRALLDAVPPGEVMSQIKQRRDLVKFSLFFLIFSLCRRRRSERSLWPHWRKSLKEKDWPFPLVSKLQSALQLWRVLRVNSQWMKSGQRLCFFSSSFFCFLRSSAPQEARLASMSSQRAGIRDSALASLRRTTTQPFTSLEIRPNLWVC